jgi:hypothetical protein
VGASGQPDSQGKMEFSRWFQSRISDCERRAAPTLNWCVRVRVHMHARVQAPVCVCARVCAPRPGVCVRVRAHDSEGPIARSCTRVTVRWS